MGLIGNHFRNSFGVHRAFGDLPGNAPGSSSRYSAWCFFRSQSGASTVLGGVASPVGSYAPTTFFPPQVAGEMSMRTSGSGNVVAYLYPAKTMAIGLTGSGSMSAFMALVISMVADLTGAGDLTADLSGRLNAGVALTGAGSMTSFMTALGNMSIEFEGQGDLDAVIAAYGNMSIDMTVTGSGLTTANVGPAVWNAIATANNNPGTMGELLNNAGAGGNPWTVVLDGTYTAADIMRILAAVAAGTSTIVDLGGGAATVTFNGIDGSPAVVEADMTNSERTTVTLDP